MRTIALVLLLGGLAALGYGIWQFYESRDEIRIGDAKLIVEDGKVHPAIWVGGALILGGGIGMAISRNRRS